MLSLYHDLILDHYKNPRNFGELEKPDVVVKETNASCGDEVIIYIKYQRSKIKNIHPQRFHTTMADAANQISKISWTGKGCAISMAAASLLSERVQRVQSSEFRVQSFTDQDMVTLLGGEISSARMRCATLALVALRKALLRSE